MCDELERIYADMVLTPNIIISHDDGCLYKWTPVDGWCLFESPEYHEVLVESCDTTCVYEICITTETAQQRCIQRSTPCSSPLRRNLHKSECHNRDANDFEMPKRRRGRPKKEKRNSRPATKYNEFIKQVMPVVKEQYPNMTNKDRLMECVKLWREHKKNQEHQYNNN